MNPRERETVYLLFGSNQGDRSEHIRTALEKVRLRIGEVFVTSSLYETEPWGFRHEIPFRNQAAGLYTRSSPRKILQEILTIEQESGRIRKGAGYTARILDIDILFYGSDIIRMDDLEIPHPLMGERRFVLVPLAEIAPGLLHPVLGKRIHEILAECRDSSWVRKLPGHGQILS